MDVIASGSVSPTLDVGPFGLRVTAGPRFSAEGLAQALHTLRAGFSPANPGPGRGAPLDVVLRVAEDVIPDVDPEMRFHQVDRGRYLNRWALWHGALIDFQIGGSPRAEVALSPLLGARNHHDIARVFLRIAAASAAVLHGAVMLHGCAMVRPGGESAVLFLGASGAGKTTMTQRLSGWSSIADDTVIIHRTSDGFTVCGAPFGGSEGHARSGAAVPLERIVFLEKNAPNLALDAVSLSEGFATLMRRTMWFVDGGALREMLVDLLVELGAAVPMHRLRSSLSHPLEGCFTRPALGSAACS